jgi:hypothetical protein
MHKDATTPASAQPNRSTFTAVDPIADRRRHTIRITRRQIGKTHLPATFNPARMLFLDLEEAGESSGA